MNDDNSKEFIIRTILITIGIILILYSIYLLWSQINFVFEDIISGNFNIFNLEIQYGEFLFFIIFGYILYIIGRGWKNIFKQITGISITFGILFLSFSLFFYAINTNTENIVNSIQPSIDTLLVEAIEPMINSQIELREGENLTLLLSSEINHLKLHNSNLTLDQAQNFDDISNAFLKRFPPLHPWKFKMEQINVPHYLNKVCPLQDV